MVRTVPDKAFWVVQIADPSSLDCLVPKWVTLCHWERQSSVARNDAALASARATFGACIRKGPGFRWRLCYRTRTPFSGALDYREIESYAP